MSRKLKKGLIFWVLWMVTEVMFANGTDLLRLKHKAETYLNNQPDSSFYYAQQLKQKAAALRDSQYLADAFLLLGENRTLLGSTEDGVEEMEKALHLYTQQNSISGIVSCNLNIGEVYYNWAEYDKALKYFLEAFRISKMNRLLAQEVTSLNYIGKYYHSTGDFSKSIKYYQKADNLAREIHDTVGMVAIQTKIGKHFETLGNYPLALEYYLMSEAMLPHIHNAVEEATTYNHIGNMYHLLQEYDKAASFHGKSLEVRRRIHYVEGEAKSLNNLGEVYVDQGQTDTALYCFEKSHELCEKIGYTKGIIKSVQNQGEVYLIQKNYTKAEAKFHEAKDLSESVSYTKGLLKALLELSRIKFFQDDVPGAIQFAEAGFQLSSPDSISTSQRDFSKQLSQIYEVSGNPELALKYYKLYHNLDQRIMNVESGNRLAELETRFEVSLKERENEVLKKENEIKALKLKRKNSLFLLIISILVLMTGLMAFIYYHYQLKARANAQLRTLNEELSQQKKESEELNEKLNASIKQQVKLFSIIGHELRNPLWWFRNLVQMLTQQINQLDKDTIKKSLHSLNESATQTFHLMDNLLHWSRSQLGHIKLSPETFDMQTILQNNIDLTRQVAQFKELIIRTDELSCMVYADKNMVQTVVRNLLSNAIKFTPQGGTIHLGLKQEDNFLTTYVSDTGVGMDARTLQTVLDGKPRVTTTDVSKQNGNGLGLVLCREFVELNRGAIYVESQPGKGSVFSFTLPLSKN